MIPHEDEPTTTATAEPTRRPSYTRPYPTLLAWRQAHHLSQRGAAQALGLTHSRYVRIERKLRAPQPPLAKRLMEQTGVSLEELLGIAS